MFSGVFDLNDWKSSRSFLGPEWNEGRRGVDRRALMAPGGAMMREAWVLKIEDAGGWVNEAAGGWEIESDPLG